MTLVDPRGSGQVDSFRVPHQEVGAHTEEVVLFSARGQCMPPYQPSRVGQQPEGLQVQAEVVMVVLRVLRSRGLVLGVATQAT